jgi:hypothetical protein
MIGQMVDIAYTILYLTASCFSNGCVISFRDFLLTHCHLFLQHPMIRHMAGIAYTILFLVSFFGNRCVISFYDFFADSLSFIFAASHYPAHGRHRLYHPLTLNFFAESQSFFLQHSLIRRMADIA